MTNQTPLPTVQVYIQLRPGQRAVYRKHMLCYRSETNCHEHCEDGHMPRCCWNIYETRQCEGRCGMHEIFVTHPRFGHGQSEIVVIEYQRGWQKRQ